MLGLTARLCAEQSRSPVCRVKVMYNHVNKKNGEAAPLVSEELYNIVMAVRHVLLCT